MIRIVSPGPVVVGVVLLVMLTLTRFREAISDHRVAGSFDRTRADLAGADLHLNGDELKTAPRGWPRDHPRVDLLRLRNLALSRTHPLGPWLHTPQCLDVVLRDWRRLATWNDWLVTHIPPPTQARAAAQERRCWARGVEGLLTNPSP